MPHHPNHANARCGRAFAASLGVTLGLALGASAAQAALPRDTSAVPVASITTSPVKAALFGSGATGLATSGATEIAQRARSRCDRLQRRLKRQRDDGTLNAQDLFRLRRSGC